MDRRHSGGFLLRIMPPSWHPVPACTPRLCCRRAVLLAGTMALQAEPFYFAAKTLRRRNHSTLQQRPYAGGPFYFAATKIGIGRGIVAVTTFRRRNCSTLRQRKIESDAAPLRQRPLQAGHSTRRHDSTAVIPDFRPRLANRCSQKIKTRAILASILDFRPRLANRCSQKAKTGANRASILDFKPRLANRCRQKVKTGAIPAAQGVKHCAAAGECRMGRDFGRRSRPWLRER